MAAKKTTKTGRKTKLTPARVTRLVESLREGNYISTACQATGISESTFYNWMNRGELGRSPFVEFVESIKKADAEGEMHLVGHIKEAATDGTWQAAAWILERKYPDRWGTRSRLNVQQNIEHSGSPEVKDPVDDSPEHIAGVLNVLASVGAIPNIRQEDDTGAKLVPTRSSPSDRDEYDSAVR